MITLTLMEPPSVPLEAEVLSPDALATLSNADIRALPVFLGKRQKTVADFFEVDGEASDEVVVRGDASRVKWLGRAMTRGRLTLTGDVGMHTGAYMQGGHLEIAGNAGDWLAAEMTGGFVHVRGNAGGQCGAAYRGSMTGMSGGTILIDGNAGLEVGMRMKRGTIVVGGAVKDFAGLQMKGGTIVLGRGAELRTGSWMNRGTIVSLVPIQLLPTFAYATTYNPTFLRVYGRYLATFGVTLPYDERDGSYERYTGDSAVPGKGEILLWKPS